LEVWRATGIGWICGMGSPRRRIWGCNGTAGAESAIASRGALCSWILGSLKHFSSIIRKIQAAQGQGKGMDMVHSTQVDVVAEAHVVVFVVLLRSFSFNQMD